MNWVGPKILGSSAPGSTSLSSFGTVGKSLNLSGSLIVNGGYDSMYITVLLEDEKE